MDKSSFSVINIFRNFIHWRGTSVYHAYSSEGYQKLLMFLGELFSLPSLLQPQLKLQISGIGPSFYDWAIFTP